MISLALALTDPVADTPFDWRELLGAGVPFIVCAVLLGAVAYGLSINE